MSYMNKAVHQNPEDEFLWTRFGEFQIQHPHLSAEGFSAICRNILQLTYPMPPQVKLHIALLLLSLFTLTFVYHTGLDGTCKDDRPIVSRIGQCTLHLHPECTQDCLFFPAAGTLNNTHHMIA